MKVVQQIKGNPQGYTDEREMSAERVEELREGLRFYGYWLDDSEGERWWLPHQYVKVNEPIIVTIQEK